MSSLLATYGTSLLQAHRKLLRQMKILAAVLARPETGQSELANCLDRLEGCLAEHFQFEEHNGYLDSILDRQPHLEWIVRGLAIDHAELLRGLARLREKARKEQLSTAMREQVSDWLMRLCRHEQSENNLLADAFNLDISIEN